MPANSEELDDQERPAVAMDDDGDFVVAWDSNAQDGDLEGVYAQRFDASGAPQGGEFAVNTITTGSQERANAAIDADGDFVIVWEGTGADADDVHGRRFSATGTPAAGEFSLSSSTDGLQERPTVAMDDDGDFVAGWQGNGSGDPEGAFLRAFTAAGAPLTDEVAAAASSALAQGRSFVGSDADGDIVVSWQSETGDGSTDVFARRFARALPGPGTGAGPGPGPAQPPGPGPELPVADQFRLSATNRAVVASMRCLSAGCNARMTTRVSIRKGKTFRLKAVEKSSAKDATSKLEAKLPRKARRAVTRALRRGKRVRAKVVLVIADTTGRSLKVERSGRVRLARR